MTSWLGEQATALGDAQGRLRIARNHTAEDYNMLKLTMEARRSELLQMLSSEHKVYTKATQARAEVRSSSLVHLAAPHWPVLV